MYSHFKFQTGKHCFYSTLHNIFLNKNISLQEYEIYFLCNGMKFEFDVHVDLESVLNFMKIDYHYQLDVLSKTLSLDFQFAEGSALTDLFDCFFTDYNKKLPAILFLNSSVLQYHILQNPQPNLGAHCLVLWEINSKYQSVLIGDSYVLDQNGSIHKHILNILFEELLPHLIGIGTFCFDKFYLPPFREIIDIVINRIIQFALGNERQGLEALKKIIESFQRMENARFKDNKDKMFEIIFLFKAYFSSTLGYFQDLLSDKRLSFENNSLILNLADLERQWQNYYTRCLTIISGNDHALVKKIIQNGYNLLTLQKKLFISIAGDLHQQLKNNVIK